MGAGFALNEVDLNGLLSLWAPDTAMQSATTENNGSTFQSWAFLLLEERIVLMHA